jgi:hypothetical protein
MTKNPWVALIVMATAVAPAEFASPAAAAKFTGHCQFARGAFTYARPVGFLPTHVRMTIDETGVCSGTLDGRRLKAYPTRIEENLQEDIGGCGPTSDAHGRGVLTFASGVQLRYSVRHGLGLGQPVRVRGVRSGRAVGLAEAFTENKPAALGQCARREYRSGPIRYLLETVGALNG